MATIYSGSVFYHRGSADCHSTMMVRVLNALKGRFPELRARGMYAADDRCSRWKRLSKKGYEQLLVDIRGGVYDVLFVEGKGEGEAHFALSASLSPDGVNWFAPLTVTLELSAMDNEDLTGAEGLALAIWDAVGPDLAVSVLSDDWKQVAEELSLTPIGPWNEEGHPQRTDYLRAWQRRRNLLGRIVKVGWRTLLNESLVSRLGGLSKLQKDAPSASVVGLSDRGALIKLTEYPLTLGDPEYVIRANTLQAYMDENLMAGEASEAD